MGSAFMGRRPLSITLLSAFEMSMQEVALYDRNRTPASWMEISSRRSLRSYCATLRPERC
jgi:hypothetical protein